MKKTDPIYLVSKFEAQFSRHLYNGGGKSDVVVKEGEIPVLISAPHAVNQLRDGQQKMADRLTGGIALYLHQVTGCHVFCSARYTGTDPNYDSCENGGNPYQTQLAEYVEAHKIKMVIDLHGAASSRDYAVEMGTAPVRDDRGMVVGDELRSLHGHSFVADLIRYAFDFVFRDLPVERKEVSLNRIFDAGTQNTVTKYISEHTRCSCVQLEMNAMYRDTADPSLLLPLLDGLSRIVCTLGHVDWTAKRIAAFRLWQSGSHKPQDKVELSLSDMTVLGFRENSLLYLCSHHDGTEMVRLHRSGDAGSPASSDREYLFLTNRLIENLFGREWIQGEETEPFLRGAPVVLYEDDKDVYPIGLPKANQIGEVSFSSELYKSKLPEAEDFEFVVFNRYTDSRFYIDFSKSDYKDHGRVKDRTGLPAEKVMVPRYYRRLLGYLDTPFRTIRYEEFLNLCQQIEDEVHEFLSLSYVKTETGYRLSSDIWEGLKFKALVYKVLPEADAFFDTELDGEGYASLDVRLCKAMTAPLVACYERMPGEVFYRLRDGIRPVEEAGARLDAATALQKYYGLYDRIEILRVPKDFQVDNPLGHRLYCAWDRAVVWLLKKMVGDVEYYLRAEWTSETDDRNNVARLSPNMMSLIGVSENDKIIVKFGRRTEALRVLVDPELSDDLIGLPAPTRKRLGMNSVNDIITVSRDMKHAFKRHSQGQTVAIIGLVLAVFQVTDNLWLGFLLCLVFTPLVLYFILNEERIKVK